MWQDHFKVEKKEMQMEKKTEWEKYRSFKMRENTVTEKVRTGEINDVRLERSWQRRQRRDGAKDQRERRSNGILSIVWYKLQLYKQYNLPWSIDHLPVGDGLCVWSVLNSSQTSFYSSISRAWFGNTSVWCPLQLLEEDVKKTSQCSKVFKTHKFSFWCWKHYSSKK